MATSNSGVGGEEESSGHHEDGVHKIRSTTTGADGEWLYDKKTKQYIAKSWGVVNASPLDLIAFAMHQEASHYSKVQSKKNVTPGTTVLLELLKKENAHNIVIRDVRKLGHPFLDREFVHRVVWYQTSETEYVRERSEHVLK